MVVLVVMVGSPGFSPYFLSLSDKGHHGPSSDGRVFGVFSRTLRMVRQGSKPPFPLVAGNYRIAINAINWRPFVDADLWIKFMEKIKEEDTNSKKFHYTFCSEQAVEGGVTKTPTPFTTIPPPPNPFFFVLVKCSLCLDYFFLFTNHKLFLVLQLIFI